MAEDRRLRVLLVDDEPDMLYLLQAVVTATSWEIVGPEARFVHQGMTSSDVLDTCFSVQLTRAADLLAADLNRLLAALKTRAYEHKFTPTIGRSHG